MQTFIEAVVCVLLLLGSAFTLIGAIGLARLPDFYMRLHGPTKSTTLGVGGVVLASVVYFSAHSDFASLHEVLIPAFLFLTAPISAHMLTKAGIQQRVAISAVTRGRPTVTGASANASANASGERAQDASMDEKPARDA
ncbi:Na+/H+ antiporter subunit G [Paraburkholderia mimosarum]|uniref:Na+/H+ antiporter subunit G n=1 Tax=Paraburkholderia mimosarum TaxID=312026 RepID=UPI00042753C1|nr:Na+/H+ antiporter subunit G [Paraburkholderia mimosarum]